MADAEPLGGASIDDVTRVVAGFMEARNKELDIAALGFPSKLPFKAVSLRELLIHRISDVASAALECYRHKMSVAALLLTRAVMETTALAFALHKLVTAVLGRKALNKEDDAELMKMLFGRKDGKPGVVATNILTRIDAVDRKYKGFRWQYEKLSEVAHPNHDGLLGAYGLIHREEFTVDLGETQDIRDFAIRVGLPALATSLDIAQLACNELADVLPEFSTICHDALPFEGPPSGDDSEKAQ